MREILFRAKAINRDKGYHRSNYKNGDWVYGLITRMHDDRFEDLPAEMTDENGVSGIEIDHNTLCQYTGLTDKNGNKIWENDVVKGSHWAEPETLHHFKVDWSSESGLIDFQESPTTDAVLSMFDFYNFEEVEVIGNIFDNPDLLQ